MLRTRSRQRRVIACLAFMLFGPSVLAATEGSGEHSTIMTVPDQLPDNFADLPLRSDLRALSVIVSPGGPAGGCTAVYSWSLTFGGCRRAVSDSQTETATCPAGYIGNQARVRTRTGYVLQSNAADIQYDTWGAWSNWDSTGCTEDAPSGPVCQFQREAPQSHVFFFRMPGGSPVVNLMWEGTSIINSPIPNMGVIPGYTYPRGLLWGGHYYTVGQRMTVPGTGAWAEEFYEICRQKA